MPAAPANGTSVEVLSGTCARTGDVVYGGATIVIPPAGTPVAASPGVPAPIPVGSVAVTVKENLASLIAGNAAVVVPGVACGDIGGSAVGADLVIGLGEVNGSGEVGAAWLHDGGAGTTTVRVVLIPKGATIPAGAPGFVVPTAPAGSSPESSR